MVEEDKNRKGANPIISQMKKKEYRYITLSAEKDSDLIFVQFKQDLRVNLDTAMEIVANRLYFTENKRHYAILDLSNIKQVTPEAKEYMQRGDAGLKNILGAAFIANNPVSELIATVFVKTPKDFQAKFFSNKEEAVDWITKNRQRIIDE
jgi:hypothetical protein